MDIEQIIRYENEHSSLDFKAAQYARDSHEELLADVLAFANAQVEASRRIIVGVKHRANGERQIIGIPRDNFVDQSNYQQLVQSNINPSLTVTYEPYELDGKLVGVLCISGCDDQPYLMKKDYGNLSVGDGFIRKGTTKYPLTRADLDLIYHQKAQGPLFDEVIEISFHERADVHTLTISPVATTDLPSQRAAAEIRAILANRQHAQNVFGPSVLASQQMASAIIRSNPFFGSRSYQDRTDEELKENLTKVEETYKEDDIYEFRELRATKLNFYVSNVGTRYLEDASLQMTIPAAEGLFVADHVYQKPIDSSHPLSLQLPSIPVLVHYPDVDISDGDYVVTAQIGDVKHHIPTAAFGEPLRIVADERVEQQELAVKCLLFGKNLRQPISRELTLRIADGREDNP